MKYKSKPQFAEAIMSGIFVPFCIVRFPDWDGGHYHLYVEGDRDDIEENLQSFSYIEFAYEGEQDNDKLFKSLNMEFKDLTCPQYGIPYETSVSLADLICREA